MIPIERKINKETKFFIIFFTVAIIFLSVLWFLSIKNIVEFGDEREQIKKIITCIKENSDNINGKEICFNVKAPYEEVIE